MYEVSENLSIEIKKIKWWMVFCLIGWDNRKIIVILYDVWNLIENGFEIVIL